MDSADNHDTAETEPKLISGCKRIETDKSQSIFLPNHHTRVQLAAVKTNLYNPIQRSLRRYDIENVQGKLSDEHSRHTLPPGMVALPSYNENKVDAPQIVFPGFNLLPKPLDTSFQENTTDEPEEISFLKNKDISDSWKKFIEYMPTESKTRMVNTPENK